jgi:predicted RNA-binding protein
MNIEQAQIDELKKKMQISLHAREGIFANFNVGIDRDKLVSGIRDANIKRKKMNNRRASPAVSTKSFVV